MIISNIQVWTNLGWLDPGDLSPGMRVISYSGSRRCCEYDEIHEIYQEYTNLKGLLGIKSKNMRIWYSPDHPLLLENEGAVSWTPIQDIFMRQGSCIISKPFEPYGSSADLEDIKWSARYMAMFSREKYMPQKEYAEIKKLVRDIVGHEAQEWLQEFYRWNILIRGVNWMKSALTRNRDIRDTMLHIAPRAGVGFCWWPMLHSRMRAARITTLGNINLNKTTYGMKDYSGLMFDIKTKNKNYLVKYRNSAFLVASNLG
mgnify:CR=1 FL=1